MRAVKTRTLATTSTPQQVFDAALGVVQNGKFKLLALDNEIHRLGFTSGLTPLSWGQEYLVDVSASDGGSTLQVVCGSHEKAPKALMDGWKGGKAADKYVASVQAVLDGTTTAPVTPVASFTQGDDGPTPA